MKNLDVKIINSLTILPLTFAPPKSSNSSSYEGYKYDTCPKTRIMFLKGFKDISVSVLMICV